MSGNVIHEINCTCCKPKSEGAALILDKIHEVLGGVPSPDKSVIDSLKEVDKMFKNVDLKEVNAVRVEAGLDPYPSTSPDGGSTDIKDIIKIAEAFLTRPVNEVPVDNIKLEDKDANKKIGKFNLAELSDVPGIDMSKLLDFSKLDLSKLDKIQFSVSVPTIMIEKSMKIGPFTVGIKFVISLKEIAWFPVVGIDKSLPTEALAAAPPLPVPKPNPKSLADVKKNIAAKNKAEKEKALSGLKGAKSILPLSASSKKPKEVSVKVNGKAEKAWKMVPMTVQDVKNLARKIYPDSPEVKKIVDTYNTKEELIDNLAKIGVVLYYESDVEKEMKAALDNEKLIESVEDFTDDDCGTPDVVPAPFTPEDLKKIENECCNENEVEELSTGPVGATGLSAAGLTGADKEKAIEDILKDIVKNNPPNGGLTEEDEAKEVGDIQNFLNAVQSINDKMALCAREKQNALNNYWCYLEATYLNEIALEYTQARVNMLDALNGSFASLEAARQLKIERNIELRKQESDLYLDTYNKLKSSSTNPNWYTFLYGDYNNTSTSTIPVSATGTTGATGASASPPLPPDALKIYTQAIRQDQVNKIEQDLTFKAAVDILRSEIAENEQTISNITSTIEDQKRNFQLPSFSANDLQNLKTVDLANDTSVLKMKTKELRKNFDIDTNPVTNQVGFEFKPYNISNETVIVGGIPTNYTKITGTPFPGANLNLYVDPIIYDEAKTLFSLNSAEQGDMSEYLKKTITREKTFGDVWAKYYSPDRIDRLFTYQEQGYTNPKPQYDAAGNPLGPKTTVKIKNPLGGEQSLEVAESVSKLDVNEPVALDFWQNLEAKTKAKMFYLLSEWRKSTAYSNYVATIKAAAENEAKYAFSVNLIYQENSYNTRSFDSFTNTFSFNQAVLNNSLSVYADTNGVTLKFKDMYTQSFESVSKFQQSLSKKVNDILTFIEVKNKCIADGEAEIENKATELSKKKNPLEKSGSGAPAAASPASDCQTKLGSDPFGLKPLGNCPGPVKNCYWKEYTKKMQLVSLMPIPDIEFLNKRLFRYYPVAIQIPVPSPAPVVLPTLALGIPDPLISIPLPIVWKHLITITLPVGMFVIWIGLCGPIPGPYIMYIDEQMNPMFLVSPKGPIQLPANSLRIQDIEKKTLIEMLKPLDVSFKIPMIDPFADLLTGKKKIPGSFLKNDPDSPTTVIDNLQAKIKSAIDSIKEEDLEPDFGQNDENEEKRKEAREKIKKIKKAFDQFPPDTEAISEALGAIEKSVDKAVDSLKISSIKFPKNAKRLMKPTLGFEEFLEDINKLLDTKIDLGLPIKTISLKKEIKKLFDRLLSDPEIKESLKEVDVEIEDMEAEIAVEGELTPEKQSEAAKKRIQKIKKAAKKVAQKAADQITPEMLGFVASLTVPIPLPFPCYDSVSIPPIPPYIAAIMAAIKALPALIDGIPDDALLKAIMLDLKQRLPRVKDMMFFITEALLAFVPDLVFPDPASATIIKNAIKSTIQNFFKLKIRPPKPGAIQIVIPESLIKSLIKAAIKAAMAVVFKLIMDEIIKAVQNEDVAKVLAVIAIIKAIFSTDIGSITGADVKAFVASLLESVNSQLDQVKSLLISIPKVDFKSLKETLFPPAIAESLKNKPLKTLREGPYLEVNTKVMLDVTKPVLTVLEKLNLPFPVVLLGCALTPTRIVLTKVHPFSAKQILPAWEMLSLKNIPWLIFLDQLVATAQRQGGLVSDYVIPYYLPDPPA